MKQLNLYYLGGGSGPTPDIPDGKTVTPINDVTIWQKCAGLAPVYTTLGEILSDSGYTAALMSDDNAIDYMVRSTEWATVATVPTMTSNTTPSGECFADNTSSGHAAYRAFDGINGYQQSESWASTSTNSKVGYIFPSAVEISRVNIQCPANVNTNELNAFKIQYSDDGTEWNDATDILYFVSSQPSTAQNKDYTVNFVGKHRYWAILAISCYGNLSVIRVCEAQFYSVSIPSSQTAMQYIGASDYASTTLLANSTWREVITSSDYADLIYNIKVPIMTSNTTPEGEARSTSYPSGYDPYKAFDKNINDVAVISSSITGRIQYQFTRAVNCIACKVLNRYETATTQDVKDCIIQASNDGTTWNNLTLNSLQQISSVLWQYVYFADNTLNYKYYGLYSSNNYGHATTSAIAELQFYGRENGGVQTWLKSANITDKNYYTVSQVLSDTESLATLMSTPNAVDYLVTAKAFIADIVNNETAMALIGANDYASNRLLEDSNWAKAICNSSYFETILNTNVPIMTSNTAPKGTAFSSSCLNDSSNSSAWVAFNRNISNYWHSAKGVPQYIGYDFTFGNIVNKVSARSSVFGSSYPNRTESYVIQGFDGTDWVDLSDTITHQFTTSGDAPLLETAFANGIAYNQYRLYITNSTYQDNTNKYAIFTLIQFYGRRPYSGVQTLLRTAGITNKYYTTISQLLNDTATLSTVINSEDAVDYLVTAKAFINDICNNETAMTAIGNSNYASNALLADSDWYEAIVNSTYIELVLNVKVPIMTSNTTPSGEASCYKLNASGGDAYRLFDGNTTTFVDQFYGQTGTLSNQWIQYEFPQSVKIKAFSIRFSGGPITSFKIQATNDTTFVDIQLFNGSYSSNTTYLFSLNNEIKYKKWRYQSLAGSGVPYFCEIQFYGREDV